ncbi:hypothetical protein M2G67_21700 [Vibrio vulnificus]|nr:hypothetical protein [Vibrio vulnificus]
MLKVVCGKLVYAAFTT